MQGLFTWLTRSLDGTLFIAYAAAFLWGVASVVLSPCHLGSIPLIVGFIDGRGVVRTRQAFVLSLAFSGGILLTIAVIGIITGLLGRILGDTGDAGSYLVAGICIIIGLHMLEIITIPFSGLSGPPGIRRTGAGPLFLIGLLFGLALGPCTYAFMAPVLGVSLTAAAERPLFALLLILSYAAGHCAVIVFAGTFTSVVQRYLNWNERSRGAIILKKICGALVIIAGGYLALAAMT
ncbi:cytochrome C biogenesis protein [bacterium]|nr:cytochrome C biogenesis protein [bacterium]